MCIRDRFEPHSNPFVPSTLHEPAFTLLLDRLAARSVYFLKLRAALPGQQGWSPRGLNEDEASFGLPIAVVFLVGGLNVFRRLIRGGGHDAKRAAFLYASVIVFLVAIAWMQMQNVNHYRYLCLVAPCVALLGAELLSQGHHRALQAIAALFLVGQFATAIDVGVESRNQGIGALREPASARFYPVWAEARALVASLGDRPLEVGLSLFQ